MQYSPDRSLAKLFFQIVRMRPSIIVVVVGCLFILGLHFTFVTEAQTRFLSSGVVVDTSVNYEKKPGVSAPINFADEISALKSGGSVVNLEPIGVPSNPALLTVFSNPTAITIPSSGAGSPYPSNITVSGLAGVITTLTVTLNNVSHTAPGDIDVLLVSPDNRRFTLVSDAGSSVGTPTGQANVNVTVTFSDAAAAILPTGDTKWGPNNTSVTARPTNYTSGDSFPAPAPAGPHNEPATAGAATLTSVYLGAAPNGTWSLYVADDTGGDTGTIAGGWSIDITSAVGASATTTTVTSSGSPSTFGQPVTFTATVTSTSTVNVGTVTFTDTAVNLTCTEGAQPRPVNASGVATCTSTTLAGGNRTITGTYNPGVGFLTSNGNTLQQVTTVSGTQFSNVGNISIPSGGTSTPYPSQILVSGVPGTITDLTLTFTGLSHVDPTDIDVLLIGPNNAPLFLMSDTGNTTPVAGLNLTLSDAAATALPTGAVLTGGTFRPANHTGVETFLNTTLGTMTSDANNSAAPTGTKTFTTQYGGATPNGVWNLYVVDDTGGDAGSISGGWTLNVTTAGGGAATTTSVVSSLNPSFTTAPQNQTTFTATVLSSGNPVTQGNVTFKEGASNLTCTEGAQPRNVNGSGQATCTASFSSEGNHVITAFYNGVAGTFNISNGSVTQVAANHTTGVPPQFCNAGNLIINDANVATPYPSLIFVAGLTGSLSKVTAALSNLSHTDVSDIDILLVGPGGQKIILMSDAGGPGVPGSGLNLTFDDAAAPSLPSVGAISSGTYKPTNIGAGDVFAAPAPAAPYGSLLADFLAASPNGTWNVYVVDDAGGDAGNIGGGVCLNFTMASANTITTVTSSQDPSLTGQSVTFTATVTVVAPGSGTPTGTVQFKDGASNLGAPVTLNGSGVATFATSALTAGSHNITAVYSATGNFNTSAGTLTGDPQVVSNTAVWDGSASGDWNAPANWATNFVPLATHDVSLPAAGVTNQPTLPSGNLTVNSLTIAAGRTLGLNGGNLTINGLLTMGGGNITVNPGSLLVFGTTGTVARTSGHIIGDVRKIFGGAGSFTFPLGTGATAFSPLAATVTAGSGQLTARANTGMPVVMPVGLNAARTLQRYWTLSGSGIRSNLTFNYLDGDIPATPGTEALWNIIRVTGNIAVRYPPTLPYVVMDPANNRFTINDLESYSDWTAGEPLAPTAANANVSGRVIGADGRGVSGAQVSIQDQTGNLVWATTNPFGYYRFVGIPAGQTYLVTPRHKRHVFQPRTVTINEDVLGLDFTAEP